MEELKLNREQPEASFVMCLWKNPELFADYKHILKNGIKKFFSSEDVRFYFLLGYKLYEKGYKIFDEITVHTFLEDKPRFKEEFEKRFGMSAVNDMISFINIENTQGYYDEIVRNNIIATLHEKGFQLDIEKLQNMSAEDIYNYYDYYLNTIFTNSDVSNYEIEDLSISDEYIQNCHLGQNKGLDYGKALPILNSITMGLPLGDLYMLGGFSGVGKALSLDTPIWTPTGIKPMRDIKKEDYVFDENGIPVKVIGVFPQGKREAYEVTFSDNSKVVCDLEHLWKIKTHEDKEWRIETLKNIISIQEKQKIFIPNQKAISPAIVRSTHLKTNSALKTLGVIIGSCLNHKIASEKVRLPEDIFCTTIKYREILLQGIIEGAIWRRRNTKYQPDEYTMYSYNLSLLNEIKQLFLSLGFRAWIVDAKQKNQYRLQADKKPVYIKRIKPLNKEIEMQCIRVDSPYHTFLCGDATVTHNTSFVFENMVMPLTTDGIKCLIISNEQRIQDFQNLLLAHILTHDLDYYKLTRRKIKQGHFNDEEKDMIIKAQNISKVKYKNIKFVKMFNNDMSKIIKIIKRMANLGYQMVLFDTMKSEDTVDEQMWQQLLLNSRKIFQVASREHIAIVCTYQLALSKLNTRYLDASCLSNAKQIKEVFSEMIYMRVLADDEFTGEKFDVKPYRLERDENGMYTGNRKAIELNPEKRYLVAFVDKTRNDEDKKQILYEFNGRYNIWKEIGLCKVRNVYGAGG